jgi:hypothetical protein
MRLCYRFGFIGLAVLRLLVEGIADAMRHLIQGRSVFNSERSAGERGRTREELKTVRQGAATRERFLEGEGKKAFWCRVGDKKRL